MQIFNLIKMNIEVLFRENALWFIIVSTLLALLLQFKWKEWLKKRRQAKRFSRGAKLEEAAAHFLERKGYKILDSQYSVNHSFRVDGEKQEVKIVVDYVVAKNGKTYLVEVKSGKSAISISNSNTRRQILEYALAIPNDGVFLLDMENKQLQQIQFELSNEKVRQAPSWVYALLFLGGLVLGWFLFG